MGFFARRLSSTAARPIIRAAWPPANTALNSVGNIVEAWRTSDPSADGEPVPGLSNNGAVSTGRAISYSPTTEVSRGIQYYLKYTDHVIQAAAAQGFDSVYLGTGADMRFSLANR